MQIAPLPLDRLRWRCDPGQLGFETTDEVQPLDGIVGQDRGLGAIELALSLETPGYNLYVAGPTGSGRTSTVRSQVRRVAAGRAAPPDWCYLHNFRDPYQPKAVALLTGQGPELARDMERFVAACRQEIPKAFESEQYEQRRSAILISLQQHRDVVLDELRPAAEGLGFVVQLTPMGIVSMPAVAPGVPLNPEAFDHLSEEQKAQIRTRGQQLQERMEEALRALRRIEREGHEELHALEREAALFAIGHTLDALRAKYRGQPMVVEYLSDVQADLLDHVDDFRAGDADPSQPPGRPRAYERYRVNVLVSVAPGNGAPVVFEPNPTYYNLLGRIDYHLTFSALQTDLTLIKPGALHRANGGFLVLQARDLFLSPFAWDVLKRSLRDEQVRVENLGEQLSILPTASLKPEPVPLSVKVILIGDLTTYMLLYRLDEDFRKLFKVKAQFAPAMDRSPESIRAYAAFVSSQVHDHNLAPFGKDAVARVIEYGARLVDHQDRLATRFNIVAELVVEAAYMARRAGVAQVAAEHVDLAFAQRAYRGNLLEEEIQRLIAEGTIAIETRSHRVGQVNGLSVLDLGDYAFARPSKITARTGLGSDGVVNIEREVDLSGPTHAKGILILTGYLLGKYAQAHPLALSARLTFEQVYDEVDGDSASSAELYALLSSLSGLPIKQGIAVTGSVDQGGQIQAVGGVTTKIEGFFAVCQAQGLTGEQGVIVPEANVRHLMLKPEVTEAVRRGQFRVWAIRSVDEGIELLTGTPAGERQADGAYPEGTVHHLVQKRLAMQARQLAAYGERARGAPTTTQRARVASGNGRPRDRGQGTGDRGQVTAAQSANRNPQSAIRGVRGDIAPGGGSQT
jgi:predicted ATP-dependent protease